MPRIEIEPAPGWVTIERSGVICAWQIAPMLAANQHRSLMFLKIGPFPNPHYDPQNVRNGPAPSAGVVDPGESITAE
jgi:hypothetical protein